uniref:Uncharacterized protein n=1 Tax=Meloidogyne enterolobii TaxID=390850 RepID=A0A6V7UH33_MELEN|nr:unnamed protein product [Meloidogyne enterolobii]
MSTIPVFEGFQIYPTQSKKYSIEQLSQQLPQLFSNKNDRVAQFDEQLELIWFGSEQFSMESLISGKQFLQFPLKEYLLNNLKKMEEDVILDMAKSLIERIVKNGDVEEGMNFERLLDFTLVFMDCCAEIVNGSISTKMIESLQELYKELENLLTNAETSQKNSSEILFKSKIIPTAPLTDYYMERIELRKI